jgi:HPt (histidine-containing phosphotransfer) domain-containing protein
VDFDLVLMDCEMPVMDGYAATKAIRDWESDLVEHVSIPIVALTAHALSGDRQHCLISGMDDYLCKPFSMNDLRSVLAQWLPTATDDASQDGNDRSDGSLDSEQPPENAIHTEALEMIGSLDPVQGKELAIRVIGVYEDNSAELIDTLAEAMNDGDVDRVRTAAHALKSSSGNVGATRLVTLCRNIEIAAREKELGGMIEQLAAVKLEHAEVLGELRKWSQG